MDDISYNDDSEDITQWTTQKISQQCAIALTLRKSRNDQIDAAIADRTLVHKGELLLYAAREAEKFGRLLLELDIRRAHNR